MNADSIPRIRRILLGSLSLLLAFALWLPSLHFLFASGPPRADLLAARHLRLWTEPDLRAAEIARMRASNAEWDFMGRSFLVWALANQGLREPALKVRALEVIDRIIEETLRLEKEKGPYFFLMDYAQRGHWVEQPPRSLFLDGEIALMLGARRVLEERSEYRPLLAERVETMVARMKKSPVLSAESYPDECWTFCNVVALAAIRVADSLDGTDHSAFLRDWVAIAKAKLIEPTTGLLVSSYHVDGGVMDGPEGSSIWLVAHCLALIDADFARDQYERARRELGVTILGFGYAREWPASCHGQPDVDSGPILPILEVSAGSSGLAFVGAEEFRDAAYLDSLTATLNFAGFPAMESGGLRYCASNQVGDAVLLYATVLGPLWEKVQAGGAR